MKLIQFSVVLISILLLFGCQQNQNANEKLDILNPNNMEQSIDEDRRAQVGYVRYTKEDVMVQHDDKQLSIDREQAADVITKALLQTKEYNEVATLVTDRNVIIAYDLATDSDSLVAEDIARKTVRSVLPSFYSVYTTSTPSHLDIIESLHNQTTNDKEHLEVIERIIDMIKEENQSEHRR